jgi:phage gp36-like protein
MPYCTIDDIKKLLPEETIIQLTDDDDDAAIDDGLVEEAISGADGHIDGFLRGRYTVPLSAPVDPLIRKLSVDISIYNLYSRTQEEIPETRDDRYKTALRTLKDISSGRILLAITSESPDFATGVSISNHFGITEG